MRARETSAVVSLLLNDICRACLINVYVSNIPFGVLLML